MHSNGELHCGPGSVRTLVPNLSVGDHLGYGIIFDASGKEQCIYFTLNGQVPATAPRAVNGASLHPLIAAAGKSVRLEVALDLPSPASAAQFQRRCLVEGPGRTVAAKLLAEAVALAQEGETGGRHLLPRRHPRPAAGRRHPGAPAGQGGNLQARWRGSGSM